MMQPTGPRRDFFSPPGRLRTTQSQVSSKFVRLIVIHKLFRVTYQQPTPAQMFLLLLALGLLFKKAKMSAESIEKLIDSHHQ